MRYGHRTENEQINKTIDHNDRTFDHAARNMKMITNPKWRPKLNTQGKDIFLVNTKITKLFARQRNKLKKRDMYIGGFNKTGNFERKREQKKEISEM